MCITPATMRTGLLLVALCLACAGCIHHNTSAQRNASFSPYRNAKVGEENLWEYLCARSAALIMAERLDTNSLRTNCFTFRNSSTNEWRGTATPIDKRGYFLTAAHCVEKGPFWLVFLRDDKVRVEPARLVWRGDKKEGWVDLAILCVSIPITQTFEWAAELTNGSPVMDLGWSIDAQSRELKPQYMAGRVLKVSEELSQDSLDYTVVTHSSPLRPGDSGGPLVMPDGRLLGLNVSVHVDFQWSHLSREFDYSVAHRPDLAWLRKVIDADAALFPTEISSP
jgi:S1-C subfamily serine protease